MTIPDPKAVAEQMDNLAIRFPGTPLFRQVADLLDTLTRERDEAREALNVTAGALNWIIENVDSAKAPLVHGRATNAVRALKAKA